MGSIGVKLHSVGGKILFPIVIVRTSPLTAIVGVEYRFMIASKLYDGCLAAHSVEERSPMATPA